jgi:hypothetical protein
MRSGDLTPFGTGEIDKTFIGHDKNIRPAGEKKGRGYHHKHKVLALVDRDTVAEAAWLWMASRPTMCCRSSRGRLGRSMRGP